MNFIEITENDLPEILGMMADFYAIDHYPFDKAATEINLVHFISENNLGKAWLIKSSQAICGYIILTYGYSFEHGGKAAFIDEFYLKPKFRQKGIGKTTMNFIDEQASHLGIYVLHLEVEKHNKGGTKLYSEKGFKGNGRLLLTKKLPTS